MDIPTRPLDEDCCNSGCNPCIFDVYESMLKKVKLKSAQTCNLTNLISQTAYTKFKIKKVDDCGACHKIITFIYADDSNNSKARVLFEPGQYFLLKFVNSDNSIITRAYTPLPVNIVGEDFYSYGFKIIIKVYDPGLVSSYLFNSTNDMETYWRGPYGNFKYQVNTFKQIVMVAQGTGVAPFISIIKNILHNENDMTKLFLWCCFKNTDSILFRNELLHFKSFWNFHYRIFISELPTGDCTFKVNYNEPILFEKLTFSTFRNNLDLFNEESLINICGSSNFMASLKEVFVQFGIDDQNIFLFL